MEGLVDVREGFAGAVYSEESIDGDDQVSCHKFDGHASAAAQQQ
jgi:hypothetical protein